MKKTRVVEYKYHSYTQYEPQYKTWLGWLPISPDHSFNNLDAAIERCKQFATPAIKKIHDV